MVNRAFLVALLPVVAFAQTAPAIRDVSTTATQAVISYTAPDSNACTVQVSKSSNLTPLVHDVDPSLFAGSSSDSRAGSIRLGTERTVVIGKRSVEQALDGKLYSRALQAFTTHYFSITCNGVATTGNFQTVNPPLGNLSQDVPGFNSAGFGNYAWPTIDWTNSDTEYVDPFSGLLTKRVTFPGGSPNINASPFIQSLIVQDGSNVYQNTATCTGSKWTNPCAIFTQDGNAAVYSGTGGDPLEVSVGLLSWQSGGFSNAQGGLANFQVSITGSGSDSNPANRQVNVCLSSHVFTGVCDSATVAITLPLTSAATVSYPATIKGDQFLSDWLDATHVAPLSYLDATQKTVSVSANGTTVTWTGDPANTGAFFNTGWRAGDHINIPGSSPGCPLNECTIAQVSNAQTLSTSQTPSGVTGNAVANNFGVILSKATGAGSVKVDYIGYAQSQDIGFSNYASGQSYYFSPKTVQVCVDRNGNAINPCRQAYSTHVPFYALNVWELFFPDNGEARFVDPMQPPNQSGVDGYSNAYCQNTSAGIDGANPMKSWCEATGPDGANIVLVSGSYQYNPANGCDYRHYGAYFTAHSNPCVVWVNETPYSTGNDLTTKTRAIWPTYNPLYDGALQISQMDETGRYIIFKAVQGYGPASNGADRFGAALVFDTQTKTMVQKFDSYSTYPARFGQMHGGAGETYAGYFGEFISTYTYTGLRGTAPYTLDIANIAGRTDNSLDPGFVILAATATGGVTHLTTTPHQLGNSANSQIFIAGTGNIFAYAKTIDATHLDLYQDAGFHQGLVLSHTAATPYPAPGDAMWTGQTFFAQPCPAGLSSQWQAMGVVAGAPNCVTMTFAGDVVKETNVDSQATNYIGPTPVLKVNVLSGGSGYAGTPSCSISGGAGTGATCAATFSSGSVSSVQVNNQGSGYSYPRVVIGSGISQATASAVLSSNGSIASVNIDQGGLYTAAPSASIWTGPGNGSGATLTASLSTAGSVNQISITNPGTGYYGPILCSITGGGGSGATCIVSGMSGSGIGQITLSNGGSGYTSPPTVVFTGSGSGAAASVTMAYPVASVAVTNGGAGYSMPVASVTGSSGSGAVLTVGLNEELTYYPYPHNAATCGGDGTTPRCWTQPLTLQEGDAFGFANPPQNPYQESPLSEKPFIVKLTRNPDSTITTVVARLLGACVQTQPVSTSWPYYRHMAIPIQPQMIMAGTCQSLNLTYAATDTSLSNPLPDNYAVNHGDFITPQLSGAVPWRVENEQSLINFRPGAPPAIIGQPYQFSSAIPPTFAGSSAKFSYGLVQTHPSTRQWQAGANELRWHLDTRPMATENGGVTQIFQESSAQIGACSGTTCIYDVTNPYGFDPKRMPLAAWAGRYLLQDVSGPGSLLSAATPWQYCFSYRAGECVAGSPQGHLYMVVDKATAGANQWCGTSYFVNTPCAVPANADLAQDVQVGSDRPDPAGIYWRPLGRMWRAWNGNIDGFTNARATPDGSWAWVARPWANGVHCDWFAVKLPPWPGADQVDRSTFVPVPVQVGANPAAATARIRFGYAENGAPTNFFCSTRQEACSTSGNPYAYASETQTDTPCAIGCTVNIPAIAGRIVYYEVDRLDSNGNLVSASPLQAKAIP